MKPTLAFLAGLVAGIATIAPFGAATAEPVQTPQPSVLVDRAHQAEVQLDALQRQQADAERAVMDPVPPDYRQAMYRASQENRLPPQLLVAVCEQETGCRPGEIGQNGERGLFQVLPETARAVAAELHLSTYDLNGTDGIRIGARYLRGCIDAEGGDIARGLARYNAGGNWRDVPQAQWYAAQILGRMAGGR